jgi:hypothetical protein
MPELKNKRSVVTGASSGIGADMARTLASWGSGLLLVARRADRLEALAAELRSAHGVDVDCAAIDLATPDGPRALFDAAYAGGAEVDILINNAGFGDFHGYCDVPWERHAQMIQLNVATLAELSHRFGARMLARDTRCHILNVGSVVAYLPIPNFVNYCATKAYVRSFSEALAAELAGTNVRVTCLSPGATKTEFLDVAGQRIGSSQQRFLMSSHKVAMIGLNAMLRGKRNVVTGGSNKLVTFMTRLLPRRTLAWSSRKVLGRPAPALPEVSS